MIFSVVDYTEKKIDSTVNFVQNMIRGFFWGGGGVYNLILEDEIVL